MRQARLKAPAHQPSGFYHCISRVVDGRFVLDDNEKEIFARLLRESEAFSQVHVLTYCVLSNHFHVLVEVPRRPDNPPSMDEIVGMLERLSGHQNLDAVRMQLDTFRRHKDAAAEKRLHEQYLSRMWDIGAFMKHLKQRFTQSFNSRHQRRGTLWEQRYKSVLVEGAGKTLATMAAYIDLNPVRAGIVNDPKDYRWSGYAEALAGRKRARMGIERIVTGLRGGTEEGWKQNLELYRVHLFTEGREEREGIREDGSTTRGALKHVDVQEVIAAKGRLPAAAYVRNRVRYFTDGAVLGSREFVDQVFTTNRKRFGANRTSGARRMRGVDEELYTLRDLQVNVFGQASTTGDKPQEPGRKTPARRPK